MDADDDRQHKLVVAGRILLSRTHPSAWLQSAAARNVLAKDHKFGFRTIIKIRKSLDAYDSHEKELAIQAACHFYANHPVFRQPFEGLITLSSFRKWLHTFYFKCHVLFKKL
jgi:hypothetical protein